MVRKLLRAALIASVAITVSSPASATQWGNYHWATTNKVLTVSVNKSIDPTAWAVAVDGAISDWDNNWRNYSTVQSYDHLTLRAGTLSPDPKKCSPINGQILVCDAAYGQRQWLGIANIWTSGDHILKATTRLNDSYFASGFYNKPEWRNMVACQEIGHDFGLDHQDTVQTNLNLGTCMDYTNDPAAVGSAGLNNEHPNKADFDSLDSSGMYGHADSTATATFAASATNFGIRAVGQAVLPSDDAPGGLTAAEWGTPIHRDARGRADTFVRHLGAGRKLLTHVFWALDAKGNEAN